VLSKIQPRQVRRGIGLQLLPHVTSDVSTRALLAAGMLIVEWQSCLWVAFPTAGHKVDHGAPQKGYRDSYRRTPAAFSTYSVPPSRKEA